MQPTKAPGVVERWGLSWQKETDLDLIPRPLPNGHSALGRLLFWFPHLFNLHTIEAAGALAFPHSQAMCCSERSRCLSASLKPARIAGVGVLPSFYK